LVPQSPRRPVPGAALRLFPAGVATSRRVAPCACPGMSALNPPAAVSNQAKQYIMRNSPSNGRPKDDFPSSVWTCTERPPWRSPQRRINVVPAGTPQTTFPTKSAPHTRRLFTGRSQGGLRVLPFGDNQMAKGKGKRKKKKAETVFLVCEETGDYNYILRRKPGGEKLKLKKYSPRLRKHTWHTEKKK